MFRFWPDATPDGKTQRRVVGVGGDQVVEVGVLEEELVDHVGADRRGVTDQDRLVLVGESAQAVRQSRSGWRRTSGCSSGSRSAPGGAARRRCRTVALAVISSSSNGVGCERAVEAGEHASGVDGVRLVLFESSRRWRRSGPGHARSVRRAWRRTGRGCTPACRRPTAARSPSRRHRSSSRVVVEAARQLVGAGLGHHRQHAAARTTVLGLVLAGLDVELLDRIEVEVLQRAADGVVGVVAAVDGEVEVATVAAVEQRR